MRLGERGAGSISNRFWSIGSKKCGVHFHHQRFRGAGVHLDRPCRTRARVGPAPEEAVEKVLGLVRSLRETEWRRWSGLRQYVRELPLEANTVLSPGDLYKPRRLNNVGRRSTRSDPS
jgi:hypothetical protein